MVGSCLLSPSWREHCHLKPLVSAMGPRCLARLRAFGPCGCSRTRCSDRGATKPDSPCACTPAVCSLCQQRTSKVTSQPLHSRYSAGATMGQACSSPGCMGTPSASQKEGLLNGRSRLGPNAPSCGFRQRNQCKIEFKRFQCDCSCHCEADRGEGISSCYRARETRGQFRAHHLDCNSKPQRCVHCNAQEGLGWCDTVSTPASDSSAAASSHVR